MQVKTSKTKNQNPQPKHRVYDLLGSHFYHSGYTLALLSNLSAHMEIP